MKTTITMDVYPFKAYLEVKNYREATIKTILKMIKEYHTYLQQDNPPNKYGSYLQSRPHKVKKNKRLNSSTINYHYYALRVYFNYLETYHHDKSKTAHLLNLEIQESDIHVWNSLEVKKLFDHTQNLKEQSILALLYHLGLRASEAVNLQVSDINLQTATAFISRSKTGWQRLVPINSTAKAILENYLTTFTPTHYFLQGRKGKMHANSLQGIIKKITIRTKIKKRIYPHLLRHSIATELLKNGMQLEEVSFFLGHQNIDSTQRYTHLKEG